jgi:hypothetical protein
MRVGGQILPNAGLAVSLTPAKLQARASEPHMLIGMVLAIPQR